MKGRGASEERRALRKVRRFSRAWDPLNPMAPEDVPRDEYDAYTPPIVRMLREGCTEGEPADHLARLRTEIVTLGPDPQELAKVLWRYRGVVRSA